MTTAACRPSLRKAIDGQCRNCIYDPLSRGTWREQVAACVSANCSLFTVRPVPRDCLARGAIDRIGVGKVRAKLERVAGG